MKRSLAALTLLSALVCPSSAFGRAVQDVTLSADASDIVLTVASDEALHAPYIKTFPGMVRIRMYDAHDTPVLRLIGDGGAVRAVDVGNGSDQTAAVTLTLGDKTKLAPSDVRVERDAKQVVFKISRGLLPALHEGSPMPVVAKPVAAKTIAPVAKVPEAPAPVVAAPVVQPAPVIVAKAAETPKPESGLAGLGAKKAPAKPAAKPAAKLAQGGGSSTMPILLSVSALLGLAYGAMRFMMRRNASTDIPAIDIVAQRRIGPRHQLVIVRAFDRDYLLSIQGGQTTVVARSTRKRAAETDEEPIRNMLEPAVMPRRAAAPPGRDFEDDEATFGGELFKAALDQREKAREQTAGFRLEAARAEARAELARLEATRDEFGNALEPSTFERERERERECERARSRDSIREIDRERESDRVREQLSDRARDQSSDRVRETEREPEAEVRTQSLSDQVPIGMSDSVSGLLRLRKASGR